MYPINIPNPKIGTAKQYNNTPHRLLVPCGKCVACLSNKRKIWSYRLSYELRECIDSYFVTLTHDNDNLYSPHLQKDLCQNFIKRLRKVVPFHLRYFLAAEYGSITNRPHYHVIFFLTEKKAVMKKKHNINYKNFPESVQKCWKSGFCHFGKVTPSSINYVTKYLITNQKFPSGLKKPFLLMSRKPMLGFSYVKDKFNWHLSDPSRNYMPGLDGKKTPLHRGFRNHLNSLGASIEVKTIDDLETTEISSLLYMDLQKKEYQRKTLHNITKHERL